MSELEPPNQNQNATQPGPAGHSGAPKHEPIFNAFPFGNALLIGGIIAIYLLGLVGGRETSNWLIVAFAIWPEHLAAHGGHLTYLTHVFLHAGPVHLFMNIAMLAQVGPLAERGISPSKDKVFRFLAFFFLCGIGGALGFVWLNPDSMNPMVGASGAISGVFGGYLWAALAFAPPGSELRRAVGSSALIFLMINVGLAAAGRVSGLIPIAWESHLFGFITGLLLWPLIVARRRPVDASKIEPR